MENKDISQLAIGETFEYNGNTYKVCLSEYCTTQKNRKTCSFFKYKCGGLMSDNLIPCCHHVDRNDGKCVCFRKIKKEKSNNE